MAAHRRTAHSTGQRSPGLHRADSPAPRTRTTVRRGLLALAAMVGIVVASTAGQAAYADGSHTVIGTVTTVGTSVGGVIGISVGGTDGASWNTHSDGASWNTEGK